MRTAGAAVVARAAFAGAARAAKRMSDRGLRVLAVARRAGVDQSVGTADTAEQGMTLIGLVGMEDPPRPGIADSIAAGRRPGIRIAIVTGDHPGTAAAVAREVGLLTDAPVLLGADLPRDDEQLGALLDHDGVVVARVTPEDKLAIARAVHGRGHVVAMTGDGVNDGPALRGPTSGSRWAPPAPTWPGRRPTSCCSTTASQRS